MCFSKFQMHQNPFSAGARPRTPVGELMTLPQIPIRLERAEIPILFGYYGYFSSPKEAEARQTFPGFFLKSLLESLGNLLEICLIKFVDTLLYFVTPQLHLITGGQTTHEANTGVHRYRLDDVTGNLRTVFGPYWMLNFLWPLRTLPDGDGVFWQTQKNVKGSWRSTWNCLQQTRLQKIRLHWISYWMTPQDPCNVDLNRACSRVDLSNTDRTTVHT